MVDPNDFLGEESGIKQQQARRRHDIISAGAGGVALIIVFIIQAGIGAVTSKSLEKTLDNLTTSLTLTLAIIAGATVFFCFKVFIFFMACCNESMFDWNRSLKVTLMHYRNVFLGHPIYLLSMFYFVLINYFVLSHLCIKHVEPFYVWPFGLTSLLICLFVTIFYRWTLTFARKYHQDLPSLVLKEIFPGIKWKKAGMPNPNLMISQKLLSLKDVDLICIAAVHFSHLMQQ